MDVWHGFDKVYVVDAVQANDTCGRIYRLDPNQDQIPLDYFYTSTHKFGLAEAVELSRVLGSLPQNLEIFGIVGNRFEYGTVVSPEVLQAAREVAATIRGECLASSQMSNCEEEIADA